MQIILAYSNTVAIKSFNTQLKTLTVNTNQLGCFFTMHAKNFEQIPKFTLE